MSTTSIYIVKVNFGDCYDHWSVNHKAFFDPKEAKDEVMSIEKLYSTPVECPLYEGEDEYYDRTRLGLTSPDEDKAMKEWEDFQERYDNFNSVWIETILVH